MKVTLNKKDNVNGVIDIDIEKSDYEENVEKSLNQFRNKANIPGFRQGKVPKQLIRKMYGKSVLAEEINKLVSNELYKYIQDNNLNILGEPLPNEDEQKEIDFDKDENFEFKFDIALAPEFDLPLTKEDSLTFYDVKLEDDLFEKQMESYKQSYGNYEKIDEKSKDTDLIKGTLVEQENGAQKESGLVIENGIIMPSYIKDEQIKKKFIGANVGDSVVFNPRTAYNDNEAEIASLLQTTKENVKEINSDFAFEIKEITRYKEAEMDQALFDKVLGEGAVSTEEEFKTKILEALNNQFKPAADNLFMKEAKELILGKMKEVDFPREFLKKWMVTANEKNTAESIENDYPQIEEDLKFHLAKEKIAKEQDIKIENTDVENLAAEVARAQFAQYGMNSVPADMLQDYISRMLDDKNTVRNLYDRAVETKVHEWLKETVKVNSKEISSKDFNKLFEKETPETEEQ